MFIDLYPSMEWPGISYNILFVLLSKKKVTLLFILYVTDNAVIIITLDNNLLLLQFYCNDNCGVGSHKHNTMKVSYVQPVITLCMPFTLVQGPNDGLIPSETCSQSEQKENKSCVLTHDLYLSLFNL